MVDNPLISLWHCHSLDEFEQCVGVQKSVWGFADADLIPLRFFVVAAKIEGQVIGAFDATGKMAGFCLAVPALHGAAVYLHSHMLAVLPAFRRSGLGRRLKLEQRRDALERGIRLIEWTFDPLEWRNASFNLNRLGAIARRYVPNQYGTSSSPLHRDLPTDRLVAEWWLDSPRVENLARGSAVAPPVVQQKVAVPLDVLEGSKQKGLSVAAVQARLRDEFQQAFANGLAAVGFEGQQETGSYLLGPGG